MSTEIKTRVLASPKSNLTEDAKSKTNQSRIEQSTIEMKDIKILGVAKNLNNDGYDWFVGFDGTRYYIFRGTHCDSEANFWDYDEWY